ncbi:probable LRR receptor-like serine/threonine-protein kinase At4g36180 [Setaria italica]|nr:probable LRR receptor-like serine/threonine-protein kinase At4g36180 [Setaria italica]
MKMAAVRFLLLQGTVLTWLLLILPMPSSSSLQAKRSNGRCITSERDALLSLKAGLSDPGGQLSSWQGEDCCQWKGVHCSNRTSHVVKLDLHGSYELGGEMSSSLVGLQHLKYLDLSCNNFDGSSIPKFIGSLKSLEYLNLSKAAFGGRVPPQLGNLSNLVYLDLNSAFNSDLYSDSLTWVSHLSLLKYLDMSWLHLSAAVDWIHGISSLPSLEVLHLSSSLLRNTNTIPSHSNLTALKVLDISRNYFHTAISPNWFWNIRTLTYLDLSWCDFQAPIPYEMGNMTSLEEVYTAGNNIGSMIPPNLENLCNLKIMEFQWSNITGDIGDLMNRLPKCSWNKLYVLDFSGNKLDGNLPNWLQPLKNLSYLNLHGNSIMGPLPLWIGGLNNLTILNLGSNQLVGEINEEHLEALTNLQVLEISDNSLSMRVHSNWIPSFKLKVAIFRSCQLGPAFPSWIRWQRSMNVLDISNATIHDNVPDWLWVVVSTASYLNMSNNLLSGTLPASLEMLAARMIDLSSNRFAGPVPRFPRSNFYTYLDLSRNNLSGTLPDFGGMNLFTLALYNNSISGSIPFSLCLVQGLEMLDLSGNMLSGELPTCKGDSGLYKDMLALNLNSNNVSGVFPSALQMSQQLVFLDLAYNQFSGNLPAWLGDKLPSLALLRLRSNNFSGNIPVQLATIQGLQYIDLACNRISGQIPESIVNLSAMARFNGYSSLDEVEGSGGGIVVIDEVEASRIGIQTYSSISFTETTSVLTKGQQLELSKGIQYMVNIDLSCNNLTGQIPQGISAMVALKSLNVSWNHLSGRIPNNIGDLKALESLDLSHNELSGEIPSSIAALTSLANLSYNNLSGRIPTGNQLQTLATDDPESMYVGNIGLCGPPLPKDCPGNGTSNSPVDEPEHKDNRMVKSIYLSMIIGFIFGLWVVFCIMLLYKGLRYSYFASIDYLYDTMCVHVVVTWNLLMGR